MRRREVVAALGGAVGWHPTPDAPFRESHMRRRAYRAAIGLAALLGSALAAA